VSFPELAPGDPAAYRGVVLDGEVIADGLTFDELSHRLGIAHPVRARHAAAARPASFVAFDLLELDGRDVTGLPYDERRRILEGLVLPSPRWSVPTTFEDGTALLTVTRERGLEGVVAKRRDAPYALGTRSPAWVKVPHRRVDSFLVGGWAPVRGRGDDQVPGSLALGRATQRGLEYVGMVGSGLSRHTASELCRRLRPLATAGAPFVDPPDPSLAGRDVRWVRPHLVVDVAYIGLTSGGRLRQPSLKGLRLDLEEDSSDVAEGA
jgi:bifunctional non-homologous end joining protein LigD